MSGYPSVRYWQRLLLRAAIALSLVPCAFSVYGSQGKGQEKGKGQQARGNGLLEFLRGGHGHLLC